MVNINHTYECAGFFFFIFFFLFLLCIMCSWGILFHIIETQVSGLTLFLISYLYENWRNLSLASKLPICISIQHNKARVLSIRIQTCFITGQDVLCDMGIYCKNSPTIHVPYTESVFPMAKHICQCFRSGGIGSIGESPPLQSSHIRGIPPARSSTVFFLTSRNVIQQRFPTSSCDPIIKRKLSRLILQKLSMCNGMA